MIAVVGATGNTGRAVVKELRALGREPVSVVRNADKAREVLGVEAKTALAELNDPAALEKALQDVTTVFVVTGPNPQMVEQQNNVLDAAEKAGAKYFIRVSGGRSLVRPDAASLVGRGHYALEERLAKSKIGAVILRPGLFMQNTLLLAALIKGEGKMALPFAKGQPMAFIDVRDTGAVGARIASDPASHVGRTYEFTGRLTNFGEFAEVFSLVLGKPINYTAIPLDQLEQILRSRNTPDWLIAHQLSIAHLGASGGVSHENVQPIRDIVGSPQRRGRPGPSRRQSRSR